MYGAPRYVPKMSAQENSPRGDFRIVMVSKRFLTPSNVGIIMKKLYELANEGVIIIEIKQLEKLIVEDNKSPLTQAELAQAIEEAEAKDMVIITKRQITSSLEKEFISIKLHVVSLESVMWILKSLEKDEMTPVERSVQSRFKESFGIKVTPQEWEKVMTIIKNPKLILRTPTDPRYEFDVIKINDPVSGCEIFAIYPKGKRWTSLDISLQFKEIDQDLFNEFLSFMESYLCNSHAKLHKENERAIPGGRYGCAQFVKACGTARLKLCSLGQLSQFIQYAINKDILRYKKTLLVWNKNPLKVQTDEASLENSEAARAKKERIKHKLSVVKQAIISILTENSAGLSLAQLPLHLKYKLPFPLDLNELGFVKLKELLATMADRVKVELRGHNHPFAILISELKSVQKKSQKEVYNEKYTYPTDEPTPFLVSERPSALKLDPFISPAPKQPLYLDSRQSFSVPIQSAFTNFNESLELIRNCIYQLLQEFPVGIDSVKLPVMIYNRLGIPLDWSLFGCVSLSEFLHKYIATQMLLEFLPINPYDASHFIIRSKEAYANYTALSNYYSQQYTGETYSVPYVLEPYPPYNLDNKQMYLIGGIDSNSLLPSRAAFAGENVVNPEYYSRDYVQFLTHI